ncbi:ATP-binding cassette domain-containing protein [Heliobacterium undosum]|uniref:ATP-binding cassette domain-containing protein n=1 Tax=Heliomicrobium undosum TaxID=121734 RepID=A0A845L1A2_9FIRM|nr:methionine ABC transporter ATP-binding protein [Heliomicrobium undosum]MZP30332.1 ATP-binding cassette domain-containing protein [Heliomicrobium undosum]
MIEIRNLKKVFPAAGGLFTALDGINLTIPEGKIYGIIGPSGAGKSTLIRTINMLERPSEGSVVIDGEDIARFDDSRLRALRQQIGMIFQHFNLLTSRTVGENIAFPLEIAGMDKAQIRARVKELLPLVGLEDKEDTYVAHLSGGQKQRVGIARALANHPKILLCDEATSALDPQTTQSILRLIADINRRFNLTVVLITHEMQVIQEICDEVAFIEGGRIIEAGPVREVFTNPRSPVVKEFVRGALEGEKLRHLLAAGTFQRSNGGRLIRITFAGGATEEPLLASVIRRFSVDANILFGNIDTVRETPFGTLLLELTGEAVKVDEALAYIRSRDVKVEVIDRE